MPLPRFSRHWILPLSMFLGSFAWSFVFVSLPFYIQKMSTMDATATLRWTGWILGVSSLSTLTIFASLLFWLRPSFIFGAAQPSMNTEFEDAVA